MAKGRGGFIGQDGLNAPGRPYIFQSISSGTNHVTLNLNAPTDTGGSDITGYNVQSTDGSGEIASLCLVADTTKTLDYSGNAGASWGFSLGDSGTKAYVYKDSTSVVYQYTLSTAYDISTGSYASKTFDSGAQVPNNSGRDITFKPDGTKVYLSANGSADTIYQYSLSTAWDITTASYDSKSFSVASQDSTLYGFTFNSDGTKIVVVGSTNDSLYQYSLSTAYDISTASYDNVLYDVGALLDDSAPIAAQYGSDGTRLYVSGNQRNKIFQLDLSTAYDLSTAVYNGIFFSTTLASNTSPYGLFVSPDEQKFYVLNYNTQLINQLDVGKYVTSTGSTNDIVVTGLTQGTSYTFLAWAINALGWSEASTPSRNVPVLLQRALFAGGYSTNYDNTIDYVTISSAGNATDFGNLTAGTYKGAGTGSTTRGLVGGGQVSGGSAVNTIQYVTTASTGNAQDFGDLTTTMRGLGAFASPTRGIFGGGESTSSTQLNVISYVTIASTGNATDFGDRTVSVRDVAGASSPYRGLFAGGQPSSVNTVDYVTIASTGNAIDFGDLSTGRYVLAGLSSPTRAVFGGGNDGGGRTNIIDYRSIASTGNFADFGDLTAANQLLAGACSHTVGLFGGGDLSGTGQSNVIEQITIASSGNATDFGDLTVARYGLAGLSAAHGGLT